MILLDTNILSAMMGPETDPVCEAWLNHVPEGVLATTAISIFETRRGLERMPHGRRRREMEAMFVEVVDGVLGGRVLPVDRAAGALAGDLFTARMMRGRTIDVADTLIAGIALANRATLATRNTRHFADLATPVVDPWAAA